MSLLDNDLYKFTMQQAVLQLYPDVVVSYEYKSRKPKPYTLKAFRALQQRISELSSNRITTPEHDFLEKMCPYLTPFYLDYLQIFKFYPERDCFCTFHEDTGEISIKVSGLWHEVILYEVPILALVSEVYYTYVDLDWSMDGQEALAMEKCTRLLDAECSFSDFGTRRRRNFVVHDMVISGLAKAAKKHPNQKLFMGTSNVFLALKYGLNPVGTVAHEWTMAISVLEGDLRHANRNSMLKWLEVYPEHLHVALTDTYGTEIFLKDFVDDDEEVSFATTYRGVRQDSGDPFKFVDRMISHYKSQGIDPTTKYIVFSDSLTVDKCIALRKYCLDKKGPKSMFGVGTHFTNDFHKKSDSSKVSEAMNIVMKLATCAEKPVVKLSDDLGKHQGDIKALEDALQIFTIE